MLLHVEYLVQLHENHHRSFSDLLVLMLSIDFVSNTKKQKVCFITSYFLFTKFNVDRLNEDVNRLNMIYL
jgi:hypothetical protein